MNQMSYKEWLKNNGEISKGSIVYSQGVWYTVVVVDEYSVGCLCDNANNIYGIGFEWIECAATAYQAMRAEVYGDGDPKLLEIMSKRPIPVDVIASVLSGLEDDRFIY